MMTVGRTILVLIQIIWTLLLVVLAGCALLAWRKRMKRLFWTFSILVVLGVWAGFSVPIPTSSHPVGSTDDLTKVRFVVSGHEFRIPKAYLYYMPQWKGMAEGDKTDPTPILMRAWVRNLQPFIVRDLKSLRGIDYTYNTVSFNLVSSVKGGLYYDKYLLPEAMATCKEVSVGILKCKSETIWNYVVIYKIENNNIVFECSDQKPVSEISRNTCSVQTLLLPHVYVDLRFDRRRLSEGPEFVERIRQLIMEFYVGEVTEGRMNDVN